MAKISINGQTFTSDSFSGIDIVGGRIIINGVEQKGELLKGVVEVRILEGSVENLRSDASIHCGDVGGDVDAGMTVHCKNVQGNVDAGMSVHCGDVTGKVKAGMSVHHK